jgi:hypothetical protein
MSDDEQSPVTDGVPASDAAGPRHPLTLAVDIGGTGLKASVLSADGAMAADRVKVPTTYPMPPEKLVSTLTKLAAPLPTAERASVGFPGMVRDGLVLSAPHFSTKHGPGSAVDDDLFDQWSHFDLASALTTAFGIPTKVANDADIQGAAVVCSTTAPSCPTWRSPTSPSARARPTTTSWVRPPARTSGTSGGTSGSARPSPTSGP